MTTKQKKKNVVFLLYCMGMFNYLPYTEICDFIKFHFYRELALFTLFTSPYQSHSLICLNELIQNSPHFQQKF